MHGNQYVWVPVNQTINGTKITLERSNFDNEKTSDEKEIDQYYCGEENAKSCIKDTDYDVSKFKESVEKYGGFYIGRYETATPILRTEESTELTDPIIKSVNDTYSYNYVTRDEALELSKKMSSLYEYDSTTTTLCNSYAWDTMLSFINAATESNIATTNNKYGNIDYAVFNMDACNIYDVVSNHTEWTTEYSNNDIFDCVSRGGYFSFDYSGKYRGFYSKDFKSSCVGFRVIMYLN